MLRSIQDRNEGANEPVLQLLFQLIQALLCGWLLGSHERFRLRANTFEVAGRQTRLGLDTATVDEEPPLQSRRRQLGSQRPRTRHSSTLKMTHLRRNIRYSARSTLLPINSGVNSENMGPHGARPTEGFDRGRCRCMWTLREVASGY